MSKQNKIFCGSGNQKNKTWLKITINPDKISDYIQEYKGNRFVKLDIKLLSEPNQFGKDVEVTVDDWKPDKGYKTVANDKMPEDIDPATGDSLPF